MKTVSSYFNAPWAAKMDRDNREKYGTCDLDTIDLIETFAKKNVEKRADELSDTKAEARFNAIKDKFELDTIKKVEETFLVKKGEQEFIDSHFLFWDMSVKGWPIELMDFSDCVNEQQMVERLSSLLISGSHFTGSNQFSILYEAVEKMVEKYQEVSISVRIFLQDQL